jgi:tripartite-type tricarboxylate transporter receptor subunit TctC
MRILLSAVAAVTAIVAAASVVAVLGIVPAAAQGYPTRPITMVVPFPPGGSTDVIGRILAERMKKPLGQTVIIENVGGAAGVIGVGRVARASPDGYTIDIGQWDTHVANGAIYALTYDLTKDFEPIVPISSNPYMMLARKGMPGDDLKGLIAWLKANPGKATVASPTAGSQVAGAYFQSLTGTQMQIVPYRGAAPAMQDLVAAQIDLLFVQPAVALPQVRGGAIKAYAVTGPQRLAVAPDIPSVDEAGLPSLHVLGWYGLYAPKGTPKDIIAKLNGAVTESLADATVQARLADLGQEIYPPDRQNPEALAALQKAEIEKWWPIVKAANIKAE